MSSYDQALSFCLLAAEPYRLMLYLYVPRDVAQYE